MKQFQNPSAQGDLGIIVFEGEIPSTHKEVKPTEGKHIVAHSETGHHHTVGADKATYFQDPNDPMTCYLRCEAPVVLEHHRSFDTHEPIMLPAGSYMLRRQREYTPEGWRRVED